MNDPDLSLAFERDRMIDAIAPPRRVNQYRRLRCENVDMTIEVGDGHHDLIACLAYDDFGALREINLVGRGKIGHGLDLLLHDLGIKLSRAIQGRDPDTGAAR